MSYVDDRETFFTPHTPDKDTAMPTPHLMTGQYVDELVYKQTGLAVVDKDGDTWGWIIDRHKGETGWVVGDTHDDRMQALRDGARVQPVLPPDCERYEFAQETTDTTCADNTDHAHIPANDPVNPNHYQGFSNGAEVIDITENLTGNGAQAVKYIARATRYDGQIKGDPLEDLRKAEWFIRREIGRIEGGNNA